MLAKFARAMVIVAALSLATTAAVADKGASGSWFNTLKEEERVQVQTDLVLLGFYNQFVDGVFGSGTYGAIRSYQRSVRSNDTGIMTPAEVSSLNVAANSVRVEMGINLVQDERGKSALLLPQLLLPVVTPMQDGTLYSPADNSASVLLQTVHQPMGERGLPELFSSLTAPAGGRSVTYSKLTDSRLVVTGQLYGRNFYEMHFSAGTDIVGYRVSWLDAYAPQGQMIATFTASHFLPMYFLEDAVQLEDAAVTPVAPDGYLLPDVENSERIGQFLLFGDNASVIALDGEFTSGSALEFVRVLKA